MRGGSYARAGRRPSLRLLIEQGRLLVLRDFRFRYRQAYLGYVWAVARPVAGVLPLILVGNAFGLGGDMAAGEYALFAVSGFLLWQLFWDSVISPQWLARRLRRTFKEAPLRPESVMAAGTGLVLFNASFYAGIFLLASGLTRTVPPSTFWLAVLACPVIVLAGLAVGAFFVPLTFVYLDFRFALPLLSPFLLWTAPILYTSPDTGLLATVNRWNPLTYLINIPRQWLVRGNDGDELVFLACAVAFIGMFWLGIRFLRRALPMAVESLP